MQAAKDPPEPPAAEATIVKMCFTVRLELALPPLPLPPSSLGSSNGPHEYRA
jgi:hypothetical protein